jgi:diaminohydroxyphosphoribosylaminopyrimidine deaminase/5-amino-6-(5-phosphoribosylamino)uracil reductase
LTGLGTVRDDDPRLDVRLVDTAVQPLRVIVDSRLQTPPGARILRPPGKVLIYSASATGSPAQAVLEALGAEVAHRPGADGKVDLAALLSDLGERGINELHVEAGHLLNGSLVRAGLVDEFLVYMAPRLLGQGRGLADLGLLERLQDGVSLRFMSATPVGEDLRIVARPEAATATIG